MNSKVLPKAINQPYEALRGIGDYQEESLPITCDIQR